MSNPGEGEKDSPERKGLSFSQSRKGPVGVVSVLSVAVRRADWCQEKGRPFPIVKGGKGSIGNTPSKLRSDRLKLVWLEREWGVGVGEKP